MASAFDTLQATKQLESSGFERQQAEAVATVVQSVQGDLATKADLKAEILKAAVAIIGLNAAIMFGLLRLFMGGG